MKKGLKLLGKLNNTDLETGILKTVNWYKKTFYNLFGSLGRTRTATGINPTGF